MKRRRKKLRASAAKAKARKKTEIGIAPPQVDEGTPKPAAKVPEVAEDSPPRSQGTVILPEPPSDPTPAAKDDEAPPSYRGRTVGTGGKASAAKRLTAGGTEVMDPIVVERPTRPTTGPGFRTSRFSIASRTTLMEVSAIAERLSITDTRAPFRQQLLIGGLTSVTLVLLVLMIIFGGSWRWIFGIAAASSLSALAVTIGVQQLPRLARKLGPRSLPGTAWMYLGGGAGLLVGVALVLTWSLSRATRSLAIIAVPRVAVAAPEPVAEPEPEEPVVEIPRADAKLRPGRQPAGRAGVLYIPEGFESPDGAFDIVFHFHGNPEIVEDSIVAMDANVVFHITNLGEGSDRYDKRFRIPGSVDKLMDQVHRALERAGLERPVVRRVALSAWSAGYRSVFRFLESKQKYWVDSVLLMDSLHAMYLHDGSLDPIGMKPFIELAQQAARGEKLFVLTHSAVQPTGYASTSETADALLKDLGLSRGAPTTADANIPMVEIESAIRAVRKADRRPLDVTSAVHEGNLHVLGCRGRDEAAHSVHLTQMAESVLPYLASRWKQKEE